MSDMNDDIVMLAPTAVFDVIPCKIHFSQFSEVRTL